MGYGLGVDLGTTWTAAAVARPQGTVEMVALGGRTVAIPSLVHVSPDGAVAVGDTAARRGASDPERLAREVKGPVELMMIDDGNHIGNNRAYRWRSQTADWMKEQLK